MKKLLYYLTVLLFSLSLLSNANATAIGVDILSGGSAVTNPSFTLGWEFEITQTIDVTSLGVWDEGSNGLLEGHDTGIWTVGGTLLASTNVNNTSPITVASTSGLGQWFFQPISTLTLDPGTYRVGSIAGSDPFRTFVSSISVSSPLINFDSGKFHFGATLSFPEQDENSDYSLFGANFQFNNNQIPEPATMILFGVGLIGLAGVGRRKE